MRFLTPTLSSAEWKLPRSLPSRPRAYRCAPAGIAPKPRPMEKNPLSPSELCAFRALTVFYQIKGHSILFFLHSIKPFYKTFHTTCLSCNIRWKGHFRWPPKTHFQPYKSLQEIIPGNSSGSNQSVGFGSWQRFGSKFATSLIFDDPSPCRYFPFALV